MGTEFVSPPPNSALGLRAVGFRGTQNCAVLPLQDDGSPAYALHKSTGLAGRRVFGRAESPGPT
jgi:hypothetical protein